MKNPFLEVSDKPASLDAAFEKMEAQYIYASQFFGPAVAMAPEGAFDHMIEDQKKAYEIFMKTLENSSPREKRAIINKLLYSKALTPGINITGIDKAIEGLLLYRKTETNRGLTRSLDKLEREYAYALQFNNPGALAMAPDGAFDHMIIGQENAYNEFIRTLKNSSTIEKYNIIRKAFESKNISNNVKLAIVSEAFGPVEEYEEVKEGRKSR